MDDDNKKILFAAIFLAGVAGGGWWAYQKVTAPPPAPALSSPSPAPEAPPRPDLPKLEESDNHVRLALSRLSRDPKLADWLKQEDLLPRLVSAASQLGRGLVPRDGLAAFAPKGKFPIVRRDGKIYADPKGWARYDAAAKTVESIDVAGAASVYTTFEPLITQAYKALGEGNDARDAVAAAVAELCSADANDASKPLKEGKKGIVFAYEDEKLESLSLARKQLLRMGPRNAAIVQGKARAFALALGIPEARLKKP